MPAFRVRGTRRLGAGAFLALDQLDVEGPGGERLARVVVRHPGAVVVVPVEPGGVTALCVRQYRAAVGGHVLEVPAGKRDVEGEAPERTAERELAEELGCRAGRLVKLAEFWNTPGFCDEYTHLYAALDVARVERPEPVCAEEREMQVVPVVLADVERMVSARDLVDAKTIIGLLLTRAHLAGEHPGLAGG